MRRQNPMQLEGNSYNDEECRFAAFRSELECGARRVRFLVTGTASVILLFILLWLRP